MQERDELRALKREIKMSRERKVKKCVCMEKKEKKEKKRKKKKRKRNDKNDMKMMNQVKDK
jgi:hypothetical protein